MWVRYMAWLAAHYFYMGIDRAGYYCSRSVACDHDPDVWDAALCQATYQCDRSRAHILVPPSTGDHQAWRSNGLYALPPPVCFRCGDEPALL